MKVIFGLFLVYAAASWEVILNHKDTDTSLFPGDFLSSGVFNENDPDANRYSIIGNLDPADYVDDDGNYGFRLTYFNKDKTVQSVLEWEQSSWLTETSPTGYVPISIPDQPQCVNSGCTFTGLAKTSRTESYLDGNGNDHDWWWNAVGITHRHNGAIPAFNQGIAYGETLEVATADSNIAGCALINIDDYLTHCSSAFESSIDDLDSVTSRVSDCETDIGTNTDNIETNTAGVSTNGDNIGTNTDDIDTNTAAVATNTGNIGTIQASITTMQATIADLQATIGGIANPLEYGQAVDPKFDAGNGNSYHINLLYFSLIMNAICFVALCILIPKVYNSGGKNKDYGKVRTFIDSDSDKQLI